MDIESAPQLRFNCPSCGGTECTSAAEGIGQALDFPVLCRGCGAKVRLNGFRFYLAIVIALMAAMVALYFGAIVRLFKANSLFGYLGFGAMMVVFGLIQQYLKRRLLKWTLGESTRGPDQASLSRALRKNWAWLVPAALFGPCISAFGGFQAVSNPVFGTLFFGSLGVATWPVISGRAPWGFWLLAIAVWMAGTVLTMSVAVL
jgi:hypothetical protein